MPLEGRDGAWAGAKGPDLERTHQDPLRRALKDAACSIARGRWADTAGMTAQEAERRWCEDPMPSAQEDDGWRAAALVLAGIEPAVTSAMRAASKIALPSSSSEAVEDSGKNDPSKKADQVRLDEQILRSRLIARIVRRWSLVAWEGREQHREGEDENVLGGGERGERAGRIGAESRKEKEREAARAKQEGRDKGLRDRHREMGTQMQLRLSMAWGEEAVRRRAEMTVPPPWPTEMSERSKFTREEYRDLPGPDPKRNVDHPDLGYLAVADRNWPGGEDGNCSGREWGWEMKRGPTLTPASTEQMQVSPKQVADNFLGWMGVLKDTRAGVEGRMEGVSISPSPNPPQPPPPTRPSPRPPLTLPPSRGQTGPTQAANRPELEHLVLARPSPHGTPVRSTPREPSGGGPSSEGAGGSAGASSETEEKPRGKRRKPTKGKRSGKQRRIGRDETKAERTEVG